MDLILLMRRQCIDLSSTVQSCLTCLLNGKSKLAQVAISCGRSVIRWTLHARCCSCLSGGVRPECAFLVETDTNSVTMAICRGNASNYLLVGASWCAPKHCHRLRKESLGQQVRTRARSLHCRVFLEGALATCKLQLASAFEEACCH